MLAHLGWRLAANALVKPQVFAMLSIASAAESMVSHDNQATDTNPIPSNGKKQ
jgi:hypothetical protein